MQDDPRYDDVVSDVQGVPRGAARLRRRAGRAPRSGSCSTPGSASARPSSTTSSCCAGSTSSSRSGRPIVVGTSRKSFLGQAHRARGRRAASPGTIATNVLALERGASSSASTTSLPVRDALRVAAATVAAMDRDEPDDEPDDVDELDDETRRRRTGARETAVTIEITRALALHAPRRERGRARDRPAAGARPALRRRRVRRDSSPTASRTRSTTPRSARPSRSSPSSAPTARSSGCARRSPTGCSTTSRPSSVWVKASKPEPPIPLPVEEVSVEVWREARGLSPARDGYLGLGSNVGDRRAHLRGGGRRAAARTA